MPAILVTGGSSYFGQHLVPLASARHETFYTYYQNDPLQLPNGLQLDIRDPGAVADLVAARRPKVIIHTVGSNRSADMANVIIKGTTHITEAAREVGAHLIHISTDVIFDGQEAPYNEGTPPKPIHAYGRAKAAAEAIVHRHDNHTIIRTSLIYGLQKMDRGTAWIARNLRAKKPVTLFSDQRRNPVWVTTLCLACLELADLSFRGILNVAGRQKMTRAEFGLRMLDWWQIEERGTLQLGPSDGNRWPADCTLDLGLARSLLKTPLWGVDEVLQQQANFKVTEG